MLVHLQKYSLLKFYVEFKLNYSAVADISIIFSAVAYINSMIFFFCSYRYNGILSSVTYIGSNYFSSYRY